MPTDACSLFLLPCAFNLIEQVCEAREARARNRAPDLEGHQVDRARGRFGGVRAAQSRDENGVQVADHEQCGADAHIIRGPTATVIGPAASVPMSVNI